MKTAVVLTTINVPNLLVEYADNFKKYGHKDIEFIIVGDLKTPAEVERVSAEIRDRGFEAEYLDIPKQEKWMKHFPFLNSIVSYNSDNRRNIGYLIALERGADVNARSSTGRTALMTASMEGAIEVVKLLLEKGADINARNDWHDTPLWYACSWDQADVVKLLLEKGAEVDARNRSGRTPLIKACYKGYLDIASVLLENGADINAKHSRSRNTPLIAASSMGHLDVVKLLLEKGADPDAKTEDGRTALIIAWEKGHKKIEELLKAHGAAE